MVACAALAGVDSGERLLLQGEKLGSGDLLNMDDHIKGLPQSEWGVISLVIPFNERYTGCW